MLSQILPFTCLVAFASAGLIGLGGGLNDGYGLGGGVGLIDGGLGGGIGIGGDIGLGGLGIGGIGISSAPLLTKQIVAAPVAVATKQIVDVQTPARYEFKYGVSDPKTGDNKQQSEVRVGDVVKGEYSLAEPDGTIRVVKYTSDKINGFNAVVSRIGKAVHPQPILIKKAVAAVPIATNGISLGGLGLGLGGIGLGGGIGIKGIGLGGLNGGLGGLDGGLGGGY